MEGRGRLVGQRAVQESWSHTMPVWPEQREEVKNTRNELANHSRNPRSGSGPRRMGRGYAIRNT